MLSPFEWLKKRKNKKRRKEGRGERGEWLHRSLDVWVPSFESAVERVSLSPLVVPRICPEFCVQSSACRGYSCWQSLTSRTSPARSEALQMTRPSWICRRQCSSAASVAGQKWDNAGTKSLNFRGLGKKASFVGPQTSCVQLRPAPWTATQHNCDAWHRLPNFSCWYFLLF